METLAEASFAWEGWPLCVLVWSIVVCLVLIAFTWTVGRVLRMVKATRDHWREDSPASKKPAPKDEAAPARVPEPRKGPKRKAAARLFVGPVPLMEGEVYCEQCGKPAQPCGTHLHDEHAFMKYHCSNCLHITEQALQPNGQEQRQPV